MKVFVFSMFMLISSSVLAGGSVTWNKITSVAFQDKDLMIFSTGWQNPNGCQQSNAVVLKHEDPNFDKAYSLILAAYMAGKEMTAWSDDCHSFDGKSYNHIRGYKYLHVK